MKKTLVALSIFTAFAASALETAPVQNQATPTAPPSTRMPGDAKSTPSTMPAASTTNSSTTSPMTRDAPMVREAPAMPGNSMAKDAPAVRDAPMVKDAPTNNGMAPEGKWDKKLQKEDEKTQKSLSKDKISAEQARKLEANQAKIGSELSAAKTSGSISSEQEKVIKKDIKNNDKLREDLEDVHKAQKKAGEHMAK